MALLPLESKHDEGFIVVCWLVQSVFLLLICFFKFSLSVTGWKFWKFWKFPFFVTRKGRV